MSPSAATHEKARRYLSAGYLTVLRVDGGRVRATCEGGDAYDLGFDADTGWWCSCPARATCAHLLALQLVVRRPRLGP